MVILDQNRNRIFPVNLSEERVITRMGDNIVIYDTSYLSGPRTTTLGVYSTPERAMRVLENLFESYETRNPQTFMMPLE